MNCRNVEDHISAFADNEILGEREEQIRAHFEECESCSRLLQIELAAKRLVKSMPVSKAPVRLRERILASISKTVSPAPENEKIVRPPSWIWGFFSRRSVAFSTAVAAVIIIGIFLAVTLSSGGDGMSPFINTVYAFHVKPSQNNFISGTYDEIEKLLAKDLERNYVAVPSFEDFNLKVSYAFNEIETKGGSSHGAILRYSGENGTFSHFVICSKKVPIDRLPTVNGKPELHRVEKDGINMVFWYCNHTKTTRCIASDCSMEELVKNVEQFIDRSKAKFEEKGLI